MKTATNVHVGVIRTDCRTVAQFQRKLEAALRRAVQLGEALQERTGKPVVYGPARPRLTRTRS